MGGMSTDFSHAARTPQDQEFTYYAIGMVAGAVPGIVVGFLVAAFAGHAAMWLSVFGGVGIIIGLVVASLLFRRRRAAARHGETSAPGPVDSGAVDSDAVSPGPADDAASQTSPPRR